MPGQYQAVGGAGVVALTAAAQLLSSQEGKMKRLEHVSQVEEEVFCLKISYFRALSDKRHENS